MSESQWTAERLEALADQLRPAATGTWWDLVNVLGDAADALMDAANVRRERDQLRADQWGRDMLCPKRPHEFVDGHCAYCGEKKA